MNDRFKNAMGTGKRFCLLAMSVCALTATGSAASAATSRDSTTDPDMEVVKKELAQMLEVDPGRFQEEALTPSRSGVKVLRRDLAWIY